MESKEPVEASKKPRRARGAWREHVLNWQASGLSQSAYAREHGLAPSKLSLWIKRTREREVSLGTIKPPSIQFVPVTLATPVQVSSLVLRGKRGWELQVPHNTDAQWLGQLLEQLS